MFTEALDLGAGLKMVSIPAGSFVMGSPQDEPERLPNEGPQHRVTLASFFIGRSPVTQPQWTAVVLAHPERIRRDLDPKPSFFRGIDLPVESIIWNEDTAAVCAARTKDTYLRDKYDRLKARGGPGRAAGAVAHKIAIAAFHILTTSQPYRDLGGDYLDKRCDHRTKQRLICRPNGWATMHSSEVPRCAQCGSRAP